MLPDISLDGPGPFYMPMSQQIRALAEGAGVVVHIRVMANPSLQATVVLRLSADQAVDLAGQLGMAAGIALKQ